MMGPTQATAHGSLYHIVYRYLETRRKERPELVELIPELEEVRHGAEALAGEVPGPMCPALDSFKCPLSIELRREASHYC